MGRRFEFDDDFESILVDIQYNNELATRVLAKSDTIKELLERSGDTTISEPGAGNGIREVSTGLTPGPQTKSD